MARVHDISGYEVLDTLGYGARSTIFLVKDKKGGIYALKRVVKNEPKDERFIEQAVSEHEIAQQFDHPVLRKSYKAIRSRAVIRVNEVLVLMEFVDGATLEQDRPKTVLHLCQVMARVASGLHAMHESGFVHADLKPNNIMITERDEVKIIDFGQSCKAGSVKDRIQGTPDYIAPEQVKRKRITPLTDVFNLGATMYWLLTNQFVPTMIPKGEAGITMRETEPVKSPRQLNPDVPPALSSLVMNCVENDPDRRPKGMVDLHRRLEMAVSQLKRAKDPGRVIIENDTRQVG